MKDEFLSKAKENLTAAELLFDRSLFNASVNRAYFAAFQMAIAALADKGITSDDNDHKWVQSAFSNELVNRRKIYPGKFRSYLSDMQSVRNDADYRFIATSKKIAERQLSKAKEFLNIIEKEFNHD